MLRAAVATHSPRFKGRVSTELATTTHSSYGKVVADSLIVPMLRGLVGHDASPK